MRQVVRLLYQKQSHCHYGAITYCYIKIASKLNPTNYLAMSKKEKKGDEIPEGQKKTAISDEEKKRIKEKHGGYKLSKKEWIEMLNKYDKY
jgi:hypothetical protein